MASGPITSWHIEGGKVEVVTDFLFLGSKSLWMVTAAMKLKDAPWKESYDKPRQHIKNRESTLPAKVHILKAMVFPVVMSRYESWTIKKATHQRIGTFKLWC